MTMLMTEPGKGQEPLTVARVIKSRVAGDCIPCMEDKGCTICRSVANGLANGTMTYDSAGETYRQRIGIKKVTHLGTSTITKDAGEKKIKIEGMEEVMRTVNTDTARENMIKRLKGQEVKPENVKIDAKANGETLNADSARERMIECMKADSRTHKMVINDPDKHTEKPTNNFMSSEAARSRMLSRMTSR